MSSQVIPALEVVNVAKHYGKFIAVRNVSLRVMPNTIHSVIGPNGAGKTTLFHALTGTVPVTSGTIQVYGHEISRLPAHRRLQYGIARSFQVTSLFPELTVHENVRLAAQGVRQLQALRFWQLPDGQFSQQERITEVLTQMNLIESENAIAGELAHGQQRRLEIAMALAPNPKIIFLDEPTSGMGIDDIDQMKALILGLKKDLTVVLIEHNMGIVMDVSDTITVMQHGAVLTEGKPDEIRQNPKVREAYLGSMITGGEA